YALIGDGHTAALVGRNGSIDWLCVPRFDAPACFAALLGGPEHGRWQIAPEAPARRTQRRYRGHTLILETDFETDTGAVRIVDCMPLADNRHDVVRSVECLHGEVALRMELVIRFDYGHVVPWVRKTDGNVLATAGPDTLELHASVPTHGERMKTVAHFTLRRGQHATFVLNYRASHEPALPALDAPAALVSTERAWTAWSARSRYAGRWTDAVMRSLITLKALIYEPTGGIVAAPTTSLPEQFGGVRNWDYRYCWLRDATYTLNTLLLAGYTDEAVAWCSWLLRAVAGSAKDLQMLYSVDGVRRLTEMELPWLPGYDGAAPVRIGNAASEQFQLDVYGEVMDMLHLARSVGLQPEPHVWQIQKALVAFVASHWREPDEGIWEIRGPRRHFTHSKMMAWVAIDRAVKAVERFGLNGPVDEWRGLRDEIHAQVCASGFDTKRGCFVQHYGSTDLDASLLLMPLVGFLPPDDPRVHATIDAIQRELVVNDLVIRYPTVHGVDGLPPGEGTFLPCTFWFADSLAVTGRTDEAEAVFERLIATCNDVGLLSEEYDPRTRRMMGNFPQALTHMSLVNTARLLSMPAHTLPPRCRHGDRPGTVRGDEAEAAATGSAQKAIG
ncbi:MAG TPA: glycoside hydrolase family 15 protein, partial [Burkholderiaceae bacterium]